MKWIVLLFLSVLLLSACNSNNYMILGTNSNTTNNSTGSGDDVTWSLYLSGRHKAYIEPQNDSYTFNVNSHEYGVIGEIEKGPLLFFAERYCMHPVNDTEQWVTDDDGRQHYTNHRSRTEMGIRYSW